MEIQSIFSDELVEILKSVAGKEEKDLYSHLQEVGKNSEELIERIAISPVVLNRLYTMSVEKDRFKEFLIIHAYLHDLGKLDTHFQEDKRKNWNVPSHCPHALFSLPLAEHLLEDYIKNKNVALKGDAKKILTSIFFLSICTHHSDYYKELYCRFRYDVPRYEKVEGDFRNAYDIMDEAHDYLLESRNVSDWRYLYSLFNGVLRLSDWLASGNIELQRSIFANSSEVQRDIGRYIESKGWKLRDYQKLMTDRHIGCGFLRLPTGDGKTETALLPQMDNINKIIYTLPTVTTVESMRLRFEDKYFGKDNVSFSHHLLFMSLHEEDRLDERSYHSYNLRKVVVTTIDRILLALMNYRHYPLIEISLNNSYLIVDEIHSYSPFTLSLILDALEYLKRHHNTRILVMSATLPLLIEEELKRRIGIEEILPWEYVKNRYEEKRRVVIQNRDAYLVRKKGRGEFNSDHIGEIVREYAEKKKKVLVVLNTVDKAKALYQLLKDSAHLTFKTDIFLIHGRFTQGDKTEKMRFLETLKGEVFEKKPFILVSTQVVEVSLDIDFDVLYTEIAPFDALVQRCGRVNRRGEKGICNVYIFNTESELPYSRDQIEATRKILDASTIKSELSFLEMNTEYYEHMREIYMKEFEKHPLNDFNRKISRSFFGEDMLKTRDSTFITLPAVPTGRDDEIYWRVRGILDRWDTLTGKERNDARVEILKRIIEVPLYTTRQIERRDADLLEKFSLRFIDSDYSPEIGLIPKNKEALIL